MTLVTSQNGYSVLTRSQVVPYLFGSNTLVYLRPGPAGWLLAHFGTWFDANIRDVDAGPLDDWGWADRPIRGAEVPSNHRSGTALDVDATKWPLSVAATAYLTVEEIARVHGQLAVYEGAIRWGADYTGRTDPMHFEIDEDEAFCSRIMAKLQSPSPTTTQEDDDMALLVQVAPGGDGRGGGYWIRDAAGYDWIGEIATVGELQRAGVRTIKVSQAEHLRWNEAQAVRGR